MVNLRQGPGRPPKDRATKRRLIKDKHQEALFEWADLMAAQYPCLEYLYHAPNGGWRSVSDATRFKKMGVKPGAPDIHLDSARGGYHGLKIMLKALGGEVNVTQRKWIKYYKEQGYRMEVCFGWTEARDTILDYLKDDIPHET